jgi:hypothetical protein
MQKDSKRSCIVASGIIHIREAQNFTGQEYACNPCHNRITLVLHSINVIESHTCLQMSLCTSNITYQRVLLAPQPSLPALPLSRVSSRERYELPDNGLYHKPGSLCQCCDSLDTSALEGYLQVWLPVCWHLPCSLHSEVDLHRL